MRAMKVEFTIPFASSDIPMRSSNKRFSGDEGKTEMDWLYPKIYEARQNSDLETTQTCELLVQSST